jgi:hypothetical protein
VLVVYWDGAKWREIARRFELVTANLLMAGPASGVAATPVPRALVQDDFPAALWSTLNPTGVVQFNGISFTVNAARLLKMGKFFCYQVSITIASSGGVAGNEIVITLPLTLASTLEQALGTYYYTSASLAASFNGTVRGRSGTTIHFIGSTEGLLGIAPSFAMQVGDILQFTITGEQRNGQGVRWIRRRPSPGWRSCATWGWGSRRRWPSGLGAPKGKLRWDWDAERCEKTSKEWQARRKRTPPSWPRARPRWSATRQPWSSF